MHLTYVSPLTPAQRAHLQRIVANDPSNRARKRAQSLLLSDSGYTLTELADIFQAKPETVSSWLDAWERQQIAGLYDRPRSGRPATLHDEEQQTALELITQCPRRLKLVIQQLEVRYGKTVSLSTLKRLAKTAKGVWKRVRRSLRSKRDAQKFVEGQTVIDELRRRQQQGEIGLFFFDECGCTLEPSIPYAWQFPGEEPELPSSKSRRLNVLGFLSPDNTFHSFVFECSINTDVVIACLDDLSEQITQETWVVLDNASIHTSDAFEDCVERWAAQGLYIQKLPKYSPE